MARLIEQALPSIEVILAETKGISDETASMIHTHALFMKVASEISDALDAILTPHHLSTGRYYIMRALGRSAKGLTPKRLSDSLGVTQATISGLLNAMTTARLLTRERDEADARQVIVKLTLEGRTLLTQIEPIWLKAIEKSMGHFTSAERRSLDSLMSTTLGRNNKY